MSQILERTLGEHIEIVTLADDVPAKILADQGQIEQVIINLAAERARCDAEWWHAAYRGPKR